MSAHSWLGRELRSRAVTAVSRAAIVRPRRGDGSSSHQAVRRLVVCGDDPLAFRLIVELTSRYSAEVIAVMPNRRQNHGPRIAGLPRVRIVEAGRLDIDVFRQVRLQQADAVAIIHQDDIGNIHAAIQAQEVNPRVRLVLRMFNTSLGHSVMRLFHDCAVLSDAAMAAPAFVSAALGEIAPFYVRLHRQTIYVARKGEIPPGELLCPLANTSTMDGKPQLLPESLDDADLVLAFATGRAACHGWVGHDDTDASVAHWPSNWAPRRRRVWASTAHALRVSIHGGFSVVNGKLGAALVTLATLLAISTVLMARIKHLSWWNGAYVTLLTILGGAEPDLEATDREKILQSLLTVVSIALIPVVTAAVVDAVVNARLALATGRLRRPLFDHVVVVGLGNVGTRVISQLHALGVPVVAVDKNDMAKGSQLARSLGISLVIGDASRMDTLRAASVRTSRALVCLSTDDSTNIEAALNSQRLREHPRVILRLFDGEFADRAQSAFGITSSRSVSDLAAPKFAAAMVERRVIGTIPVGRRVLIIAEMPVLGGSSLDGATVADAVSVGPIRVIALTGGRSEQTLWNPPAAHVLSADDTLTVVATRGALARLLVETGDPIAREDMSQRRGLDSAEP